MLTQVMPRLADGFHMSGKLLILRALDGQECFLLGRPFFEHGLLADDIKCFQKNGIDQDRHEQQPYPCQNKTWGADHINTQIKIVNADNKSARKWKKPGLVPECWAVYLKNPFPGIFHESESQGEREKQKDKDNQHTFIVK